MIRDTEQDVPPVTQGFTPEILTDSPAVATNEKVTESVAEPGYPFFAVAVTVAVFDVAGGSGPKLVGLAERTTSGSVALAELSKDAVWTTSTFGGPPFGFGTVTQTPRSLVPVHPVWNFTGIPPALVVEVIL